MKKSVQIKNISDLFPLAEQSNPIRGKVNCTKLDYRAVNQQFSSEIFLNASITLLVLSGNTVISINYKPYTLFPQSMVLLSASHLFSFKDCSEDFHCICMVVSKEFTNEMDATDMIYKRIKYGVKLYPMPVMQLTYTDASLLLSRIEAVNQTLNHTTHLYQQELILNQLFTFYLDLSNIIDQRHDFYAPNHPTRYENIIRTFIDLLANYYRKEHKVEFYSSRLHISAHYLTLIVKRITGQSVSGFIFEMLFSEARNLLANSNLSIQEISTLLNFADQSAFGKFFKRKSGVSPADYRKKR